MASITPMRLLRVPEPLTNPGTRERRREMHERPLRQRVSQALVVKEDGLSPCELAGARRKRVRLPAWQEDSVATHRSPQFSIKKPLTSMARCCQSPATALVVRRPPEP